MINLLRALSAEHRIFRRLFSVIERSFHYTEPKARRKFREAILVLLPALERHDAIEEHVFGHPDYVLEEHAKWLVQAVELEHRQIKAMRGEMQYMLKTMDQVTLANLKALAFLLTHKLRQHFETEEKLLWPHYNQFAVRSLKRAEGRETLREVEDLAKEVRRNSALAAKGAERRLAAAQV